MSDLSEEFGVATCCGAHGAVVVRAVGALDAAGAGRLIDETTRIDPSAGDRVVVYLHDVTSLDSAGVGALYYAEAFVKARGGALAIAAPSPAVRATLQRAGLGRYCSPDDDTRQAPESAAAHATGMVPW